MIAKAKRLNFTEEPLRFLSFKEIAVAFIHFLACPLALFLSGLLGTFLRFLMIFQYGFAGVRFGILVFIRRPVAA